jgi:hypothetical protein
LFKTIDMELTITSRFIILALNPQKGRIIPDDLHFRYSLSGSVLMDFFTNGEITLSGKKIIPSFRRNGIAAHDLWVARIEEAGRNRSISYWVRTLGRKKRLILKENIRLLVNGGLIRHEKRYFLNFIPYNRYFITKPELRNELIRELRGILLESRAASKEQKMLIGLIRASQAYSVFSEERKEKRTIRQRCKEFLATDDFASETDIVIREVQLAITTAVIAATAARS